MSPFICMFAQRRTSRFMSGFSFAYSLLYFSKKSCSYCLRAIAEYSATIFQKKVDTQLVNEAWTWGSIVAIFSFLMGLPWAESWPNWFSGSNEARNLPQMLQISSTHNNSTNINIVLLILTSQVWVSHTILHHLLLLFSRFLLQIY